MRIKQIPLNLARRIALNSQLLGKRAKISEGKEGVAQIIERLGYVQIDTVSVIERSHHHTLWTRQPDYNSEVLHELQAVDRRVFEYLGHALSYLPMSDYRFYLRRMRSSHDPVGKWEKDRLAKYGHLMKPALERIREEGALSSRDFAKPPKENLSPLEHPKPFRAALELLFWQGELMIKERIGFTRVYDLTERVVPPEIDISIPDDDELGRFLVCRALSAYGIARKGEICSHIHAADRKLILKSLDDLVDEGEVKPVIIIGIEHSDYYALTDTMEKSHKLKIVPNQVLLLSPFDNLIIQRDRIKNLFGFDYTLECYVTPKKRKFGYFVLPILWGDEFVGRLDPKVDRKRKTLMIKSLIFEPGFSAFDDFLQVFKEKLWKFARFNSCERIEFEKVSPEQVRNNLKTH